MDNRFTIHNAALELETVTDSLEELLDLISVYSEFRDDELEGIDPKEPCTILPMLNRQGMGHALVNAIYDKTKAIMEISKEAMEKGYAASRAERAATEVAKG